MSGLDPAAADVGWLALGAAFLNLLYIGYVSRALFKRRWPRAG